MVTATRRRRSTTGATVAKTTDLSKIPTNYREEYDDRPPTAGVHPVFITEILEFEPKFSKKAKRYFNNAQVHLRIALDADDETAAGRPLMFTKLNNRAIRNALKYEFSVDDIPDNAQGVRDALGEFQENETTFYIKVEWKARDVQLQNEMLLAMTEVGDVDKAFGLATQEQWKEINERVILATKMTDFPEDGRGGYIPTIRSKETGRDIAAKAVVLAVIEPVKAPTR